MIARDLDLHDAQTRDAGIIERCRRGDQAAWNTLVDRYGRLVYAVAQRHGLSPPDSESVLLAVFGRLFERLDTLAGCDDLSAWIVHATQRQCGPTMPSSDDQDIVDTWRRQETLRRAMTLIGERERALLGACFRAGRNDGYAYLAELLGLRRRAFRHLARVLDDIGFET